MGFRVDGQNPGPAWSGPPRSNEAEFRAALSTSASAQTISSFNDATDLQSALRGPVFMANRGRPWMKIQDAAREQGIHLSKKEAIRLAQQGVQPDQPEEAEQPKEGEVEKNGEDQQSDFSIASPARAAESYFFEPIAQGVEHFFHDAKYSLTSTARAIIRSASILSGKQPELQG